AQQSRSRSVRRSAMQRAGADLALVGLAVLAWLQLRQYGAPLLGLRIDPVLVVAPTLGVLAATVLVLRVLPLLTRGAERGAARRHSFGLLLGAWQAGRRPHAGTVLLLSLAVAVATLAICLEGMSRQSAVDAASHRAGADLRVTEIGPAPPDRGDKLSELPGVREVLPAVASSTVLGGQSATLLAVDAARAGGMLRPRGGGAFGTLDSDAGSGEAGSGEAVRFPAGTTRLVGILTATTDGSGRLPALSTAADVVDRHGVVRRLPLPPATPDGTAVRFDLALGENVTGLYGFRIDGLAGRGTDTRLTWSVTELATVAGGGARTPVEIGEGWAAGHEQLGSNQLVEQTIRLSDATVTTAPGRLTVIRQVTVLARWALATPAFGYGVLRPGSRTAGPLPVLVTPQALRATGGTVGGTFQLPTPSGETPAKVTGVIESVPGVPNPYAVVVDLAALTRQVYAVAGDPLRPTEWRLATERDRHAEVAHRVAATPRTVTVDRYAIEPDPLGSGARLVLLPAALAVALLAGLGIAVDVRATARNRSGELAVLHTIGSTPRQLSRGLVAEQALLAGLGVLTGLGIGIGVAALMGPLLILTPDAARPVPEPVLVVEPLWLAIPVLGLLLLAFGLASRVAARVRRNLPVLIVGDGQ
ncbi:MAG: FtsX-like permease family protein, partial [Micromonosporaceae bacterium]